MKISPSIFIIFMVSCVLMSGCKSGASGDLAGKLKAGADISKEQKEEEPGATEEGIPEEEIPEEPEADIPAVQTGEALCYDGKVMFRVYGYSSYEYEGLFGEFSRNNYAYQPNTIYTFDPSNPGDGISKLCDDNGTGPMYLINGTDLYSQYIAEGSGDSDPERVYKRHLPDGEEYEICNGQIKGFSPDGNHFAVYTYTYDEYMQHYYIYTVDDNDADCAHYESGTNVTFLGMDNESLYLLKENDIGTYDVIKFTNDGEEYCLASCDFSKIDEQLGSDYPQFGGQISFDNDSMTFQVDFYEGTGHFYYASVKTTVPVTAEGGSSEEPLYEAEMEDVDQDKDSDDVPVDPEAVLPEQIADLAYEYPDYESGSAVAKTMQYYEVLDDGIFYVMAQCHRDPLEDIGWRESYSLLNVQYWFLPDGASDPVLLHTMFEPLGKRGCLTKYEYYEHQPTVYVYAQFPVDEDGKLAGVFYETINVEGPEMPIEESRVYHMAEFADDFYYEHPHDDDFYEDFDVEGMKEFTDMISSWQDPPVKDAEFDKRGRLVFDPDMSIKEGESAYMCHLAFDDDGKVYYIRPVIME